MRKNNNTQVSSFSLFRGVNYYNNNHHLSNNSSVRIALDWDEVFNFIINIIIIHVIYLDHHPPLSEQQLQIGLSPKWIGYRLGSYIYEASSSLSGYTGSS